MVKNEFSELDTSTNLIDNSFISNADISKAEISTFNATHFGGAGNEDNK